MYTHTRCQTDQLPRSGPTMKVTTAFFFLIVCCWSYHRAQAQTPPAPLTDYAFFRRIHVRESVVNCIAAFDQWVRTAPRYDSLVVSAGNALRAKVLPLTGARGTDQSTAVDAMVHVHAFAKLRQKYVWVPVTASCGVWHRHVISFLINPGNSHP
ncbi:BspC domain-containing protein [Paraburkholderia sp. D1E]|uniref:BspC domain-containing protein n=1 Tax=Paraburkholderia sp. D1E TaxID=3461398 RepID=UPI00404570E5